jgi:hypothetical protein
MPPALSIAGDVNHIPFRHANEAERPFEIGRRPVASGTLNG